MVAYFTLFYSEHTREFGGVRAVQAAQLFDYLHCGIGVVRRAVGSEYDVEIFGYVFQPELPRKIAHVRHVHDLTVEKFKIEGRKMKTAGFKVEILDVVHYRMPENEVVFVLQQLLYKGVHRGKGRVFFELGIVVRKFEPLFSPSVGKVESPFGIDEDVLFFNDIEFFVADDVTERAYLCRRFVDACTFDIEKD